MTLDHLIAVVPDLDAVHRRLLAAGFEEAWPPGPFWPSAITSGVALGGANLELYQRVGDELEDEDGTYRTRIGQLVLAPETLQEGRAMFGGEPFAEMEKQEDDPRLLALRGFPPEMTDRLQAICSNLYPSDPPYPFFLCLYAPFLRARLAPENFEKPHGALTALSLVATDPLRVQQLFDGRLGPIHLDVTEGPMPEVSAIHFEDGYRLTLAELWGE